VFAVCHNSSELRNDGSPLPSFRTFSQLSQSAGVSAAKPTDNGFIEAFNSKLRAECLNTHWFLTLADAREKLEDWRRDYNEVRPHSAIGYNVPIAIHNLGGATSPSP
jgi:Integrase core domain